MRFCFLLVTCTLIAVTTGHENDTHLASGTIPIQKNDNVADNDKNDNDNGSENNSHGMGTDMPNANVPSGNVQTQQNGPSYLLPSTITTVTNKAQQNAHSSQPSRNTSVTAKGTDFRLIWILVIIPVLILVILGALYYKKTRCRTYEIQSGEELKELTVTGHIQLLPVRSHH